MRRRAVLASAIAGAAAGLRGAPSAEAGATLGDDGLYHEPWFLESFLILSEDLSEAHAQGKRFVVAWELKGCPYCRDTHLVNFAKPEIADYVRENFAVLQLNIRGSRAVTDFDGKEIEERELADRYGVRFTPTFQFFPETVEEIGGSAGSGIEVARMTGYYEPGPFLAMFRFVREKAYLSTTFQEFLAGRA